VRLRVLRGDKNENSLQTASAIINPAGEVEMIFDIAGFPHVLSSPELNIDCGSFDAIRISYSNQLRCGPQEKIMLAIGWVDKTTADRIFSNKAGNLGEEERIITVPLKQGDLTTEIVRLEGKKNWEKGTKVYGLLLSILSNSDAIEGKLLIRSIELIML